MITLSIVALLALGQMTYKQDGGTVGAVSSIDCGRNIACAKVGSKLTLDGSGGGASTNPLTPVGRQNEWYISTARCPWLGVRTGPTMWSSNAYDGFQPTYNGMTNGWASAAADDAVPCYNYVACPAGDTNCAPNIYMGAGTQGAWHENRAFSVRAFLSSNAITATTKFRYGQEMSNNCGATCGCFGFQSLPVFGTNSIAFRYWGGTDTTLKGCDRFNDPNTGANETCCDTGVNPATEMAGKIFTLAIHHVGNNVATGIRTDYYFNGVKKCSVTGANVPNSDYASDVCFYMKPDSSGSPPATIIGIINGGSIFHVAPPTSSY